MPKSLNVIDADQALKAAESSFGASSLKLAPYLDDLASSFHAHSQYQQAEECYTRALELKRANKIEDAELITVLHKLGVLNRVQNRYAQAERYYVDALKLTEKIYGKRSLEVATQKNYLAGLYYACGFYDLAERSLIQSIDLYKVLDGDHRTKIGLCGLALALIKRRAGDESAAQAKFLVTKRLLIDIPWQMHVNLEAGLVAMAVKHFEEGLTENAEILLRHYLVLNEKLWTYHPVVTESCYELADHFRKTGDYKAAEACYLRVLSKQEEILEPLDPQLVETLKRLAILYLQQSETDKATHRMKQALGIKL